MNNVEISVGVKPINMNFKKLLVPALLAAIVLLGGALRLNGLEWDQRSGYHPDERFITMVTSGMKWPTSVAQFLNPKESPLNPYWNAVEKREQAFAYGTLPVYLTKATSEIMGKLVDKKWAEYGWNMIVGRAISGILDTLAILVLFLIGRKVFGNAVGLLAAGLYAVTTLSIQHSHFYTTDITLNFFVLLAIYFALDIVKRGDVISGFATGAAIGMALASKISAAPLVLVVPVALLLHLRKTGARFQMSSLVRLLPALIAGVAGTIVLHFIFAPYTFLDLQGLLRNVKEQNDILISGIADRPFVRQYYNTTPYLYPIEQMVRWSLGWPLGVTSLIGLGLIVFYALRGKRHAALATLTLAWVVPYFIITGGSQAKFLRYMLPILPLLALCAAVLLMRLVEAARTRAIARPSTGASALRVGAYALTALVVAGTAWWAFAFSRIYAEPHTANKASDWINANVPKDAVIAMEHWEEGIANLRDYKTPPGQVQLLSYEEDTPAKVQMFAAALSKANYIVNFSSRLYGTVPRITDRYPMSAEFYKKLFGGELGYELVYYSQSFPQALGVGVFEDTFTRPGLPRPAPLQTLNFAPIVINGGFADESFSAYDHPMTLVWKKVRNVTPQEIAAALTPYLPSQPWNPQLAKANNRQPLLSEAQAAADTAAGSFTELFDANSLINQMPLLFWVIALALLTLVGLPIALLVGRSLPDRAYI
ncbi:MAG TPA: glycosyltransferase family 39 protein, partial [Thermoflexales bacterium]|nr:glycosyltransferase family 39 protein [Thermoflexales bacterium]